MNISIPYAMSYSPWSHRAQWALEHHGTAVHYPEHLPLLAERYSDLVTRRDTPRAQ